MLITIYDRDGKAKCELSPNDSSTQVKEIQGDSVLTLSFTHYDHIELDVDDYADYLGERYWLLEKYRPKQNSRKEWVYDIKLYGVESLIKNFLVVKTVDGEDEPVFTLTAPPREHVAMIAGCMNEGMGNISDWKVGSVTGTDNVVIDYFGKYCDEALRELAEKTGAEWWVEGETINLSRCEHGEPLTLGYGKGLTSIDPGTADNVKFYTRLYPIGSSRNIDRDKYGFSRLQLPGGRRYVEINADKYGRKDHYEQDAFAGIYPRRMGEISSVRTEEKMGEDGKPFTIYYFKDETLTFDPNEYEIGGLVKRVSFQEGSELAGLGDEDNGTYYFEVNYNSKTQEFEIITIWPYDDDRQLPGEKLEPKAGDKYILWNLRMPDEYYTLAEEEFLTAVEKYNAEHGLDITVFKAPTDHVWVEEAESELYVGRRVRLESEEYFPGTGYRESRITKITRKVNLPSQMDLEIGDALSRTAMQRMTESIREAKSYVRTLGETGALPDIIGTGDKTLPTDTNLFSARRSQKEFLSKTRNETTAYQLTARGMKGNEYTQTGPSFTEGWFGTGAKCWRDAATGRTFMEVDVVRARESLETMKLRFNMVDVVSGELWQTFAYGTVESVEAGTGEIWRGGNGIPVGEGNCRIELVDGELLTFKHGDICRGIFHNIALDGSERNNVSTDFDSCGFQQIAGYTTAYFTPTALIDGDGNIIGPMTDNSGKVMTDKNGRKLYDITKAKGFRYRLRQGSSFHPCKGMNIAAYGNFTDSDRQATTFATPTRLIMMEKVDTWKIDPTRNWAYVRGDLNGLEIGGMALEGHGVMMGRAYLYAPMISFTKEQKEELAGHDAYSVHLTRETGILMLDADGNPHPLEGRYLVTADVDGDKHNVSKGNNSELVTATAWVLSTSLQVHKAGEALTPLTRAASTGAQDPNWGEDLLPMAGTYIATLGCSGCEATIDENGIIYVTAITDTTGTPKIDVAVNCEGEVVIHRHYSVHFINSGDWASYVFAPALYVDGKPTAPAKPTCRSPYPWQVNTVALLPEDASEERRTAAIESDARNNRWKDGPEPYDKSGNLIAPIWYMSKATIDNSTGQLRAGTEWSDPIQSTGEDGGSYDFMYARQDAEHADEAPRLSKTERNPNKGLDKYVWHDTPPAGEKGSTLWMTCARIKTSAVADSFNDGLGNATKTGTLEQPGWSTPVRITGEKGADGDAAWAFDLDNEMDSLPMSGDTCLYDLEDAGLSDEEKREQYPRSNARFFFGTESKALETLEVEGCPGMTVARGRMKDGEQEWELTDGNGAWLRLYTKAQAGTDGDGYHYGYIRSWGAEGNLPDAMRISLTAAARRRSSDREATVGYATWTLRKDTDGHVYNLAPESHVIHTDGEGTPYPEVGERIGCKVRHTGRLSDGTIGSEILAKLPDNLKVTYCENGGRYDGQWEEIADYEAGIDIESISEGVTSFAFMLEEAGRVIDRETVPVIRDGKGALRLDLSNEYDRIQMGADGECLYEKEEELKELYPKSEVRVYAGEKILPLSTLTITHINGEEVSPDRDWKNEVGTYTYAEHPIFRMEFETDGAPEGSGEDNPFGLLRCTYAEGDFAEKLTIRVVATAEIEGKEAQAQADWILERSDDTAIYRLQPRQSIIHLDSDGEVVGDGSLYCDVIKVSGQGVKRMTYEEQYDENIRLIFSAYEGAESIYSVPVFYYDGQKVTGFKEEDLDAAGGDVTAYRYELYKVDDNFDEYYPIPEANIVALLDRETVPVIRDGSKGKQGIPGLRVRLWKELVEGQEYRNDEGIDEEVEAGYVDFLAVRSSNPNSPTSGYWVFRVKPGKKYEATKELESGITIGSEKEFFDNYDPRGDYWETVEENLNTGFFNYLVANNAFIDVLSGTVMRISDEKNNVVGGMQGSRKNLPIIWAGSKDPGSAPVRLYGDSRGAEIAGKIISGNKGGQRVELDPDNKSVDIYDAGGNLCTTLTGNEVTATQEMGTWNGGKSNQSGNGTAFSYRAQTNGSIVFTASGWLRGTVNQSTSNNDKEEIELMPSADLILTISNDDEEEVVKRIVLASISATQTGGSQEYDESSISSSFSVREGCTYTATIEVNSAGSFSGLTNGWGVSAHSVTNNYQAVFGKNGMLISTNSDNSFSVLEEDDELVHYRNGIRQPYTIFAARIYYDDDWEMWRANILSAPPDFDGYYRNSTGQWVFSFDRRYSFKDMIVNATSESNTSHLSAYQNTYITNTTTIVVNSTTSSGTMKDVNFSIEIKAI